MSTRFTGRFTTPTAVLFEPGNRLSRDEGLDYDTSSEADTFNTRRSKRAPAGVNSDCWGYARSLARKPPLRGLLRPLQHLSPAIWSSPTRQQQISSPLFTRSRQTVYMDAQECLIYSQNSTEPLKPSIHSFPALKSHLLFEPALEKRWETIRGCFLFMRALFGQGVVSSTFNSFEYILL